MKRLRAILRGIGLIFNLIRQVAPLAIRPLFKGFDLPWALGVRKKWVWRTFRLLGVKVEMQGTPPTGVCVLVGNHRSYLDPVVVLRDISVVPVAKAELAAWTLIGYGAKASGVMFVKRESKTSRAATLEAMREVLRLGYPVLVYPEGTTHILPTTMELRPGAFRLAVKEGVPIVPVALDYADLGDAWIGDDTFIPHFLRCFGKKTTWVKIRYGQPIVSESADEIIQTARQWIDESMLELRREFDREGRTVTAE